jgi:hypothetical protein
MNMVAQQLQADMTAFRLIASPPQTLRRLKQTGFW